MTNIEKRLDAIFSIYIRLRDTDEHGFGNCFVTGEPLNFHTGECGHFIKRGNTLYRCDERNAHIQSQGSNKFQNSNFMDELYRVKMIEKYGLDEVKKMEFEAKKATSMMEYEIKERYDHFKAECRKLLRDKMFPVELP